MLPNSGYIVAAVIVAVCSSCDLAPKDPPSSVGGAVFDVTVRVVDGTVLRGQSVFRPGVPDLFCVRDEFVACKGSVFDSTTASNEISLNFDCNDGTDGLAFIQREISDGKIVPTGGLIRKRSEVWAEIDIELRRRTEAGETFRDLEKCLSA